MSPARSLALAALASWALWACGPRHISNTTPRHRDYSPGQYAQHDPSTRPSAGSLFSSASGGWLEDTRARHVGDTVMVRLDERADARGVEGSAGDKVRRMARDAPVPTGRRVEARTARGMTASPEE